MSMFAHRLPTPMKDAYAVFRAWRDFPGDAGVKGVPLYARTLLRMVDSGRWTLREIVDKCMSIDPSINAPEHVDRMLLVAEIYRPELYTELWRLREELAAEVYGRGATRCGDKKVRMLLKFASPSGR